MIHYGVYYERSSFGVLGDFDFFSEKNRSRVSIARLKVKGAKTAPPIFRKRLLLKRPPPK